jgi:hypothetical protein
MNKRRWKSHPVSRGSNQASYSVDIKFQYGDQCIPMKDTNSTPPEGVEARARVMLGLGVELDEAGSIIWV